MFYLCLSIDNSLPLWYTVNMNYFYYVEPLEYGYLHHAPGPILKKFHKHPTLECLYVESGIVSLTYYEDDGSQNEIFVESGNFLIIKPDCLHTLKSIAEDAFYLLEFSFHAQQMSFSQYLTNSGYNIPSLFNAIRSPEKVFVYSDTDNIRQHFIAMVHFLRKRNRGDNPVRQLEYEILLKQLLLSFIRCSSRVNKVFHGNIYAKQAMEYLHENYAKKFSKTALAKRLSISESYLSKIFRETYGKSLSDMLLELRVSKAEKLLVETDYRIATIAKMCGYMTERAFQYAFLRTHEGQTPSDYRKTEGNLSFFQYIDYRSKAILSMNVPPPDENTF